MSVRIVEDIRKANAVTHSGNFHADEVMATAILTKVFKDLRVFRTSEIPEKIPSGVIVYDIGYGEMDHHQKGGNGARENGVPYASAGLIWRVYGRFFLQSEYPEKWYEMWKFVDRNIIQGIDAVDNGVMPMVDYPVQPLSLSHIVSGYNPTFVSGKSSDDAFLDAVSFLLRILDNSLEMAITRMQSQEIVEQAIEEAQEGIMVLNQAVSWKSALMTSCNPKANNILFTVSPSNRGGFRWECVPLDRKNSGYRQEVPQEWRGLYGEELQKVTGVRTAKFCHKNGYTGSAGSLDDAVQMAKLAMRS